MHVRVTKVKQKGGIAEFVQLVESERHPETGVPRARVVHHFGRKDQLDIEALKRLVKSISRFIDEPAVGEPGTLFDLAGFEKSTFEFLGARAVGAVMAAGSAIPKAIAKPRAKDGATVEETPEDAETPSGFSISGTSCRVLWQSVICDWPAPGGACL